MQQLYPGKLAQAWRRERDNLVTGKAVDRLWGKDATLWQGPQGQRQSVGGNLAWLDLPGQIQQARALGILSEPEAQLLADYDRLVMQIIGVDDFAPHELGVGATRTFPRAIAPTIEGDQTCAS